jgi:uncharacterized membrane protein
MNKLILGLVVFFGLHSISLLALDWRNRIAERLGRRTWQRIYSVAAVLGLYLLVSGYAAARVSDAVLYASSVWCRYVAALLMLPAFTLALASVLSGRISARAQHPLLLATMLWAVAHLLTNGSVADLLLFGTFLLWSIAVRVSLGRRPARPPLALPASHTNDVIAVIGGFALYVAFIFWLHAKWIGVPILVS